MFKFHPIVLATLFGYNAGVANATGCYATYNGGSFFSGSMVSATTTTETTSPESCTPAGVGTCPSTGFRTVTTRTSKTYNYTCKTGAAAAWCSQSAFAPNGIYSGQAWDRESAECTGVAGSATAPIPPAWSGAGCPFFFSSGTDYSAEDVVTVPGNAGSAPVLLVYQCKASPTDAFCSQGGFEPGTSIHWEQAWNFLGSCDGTLAPTSSPDFTSIADVGGCPALYSSGADYEEGDRVSKDGLVYQCKAHPQSGFCPVAAYEPGTSIGSGSQTVEYWKEAWSIVGHCRGTITPTSSPAFVSLTNMGGCPDEWVQQTYEEGDRVSANNLVYVCKAYPNSGHCGQAGYEPTSEPGPWSVAWTVAGHCSGSIGPTGAPSFDPVNSVGACPGEWVAGDHTSYEEGDMVSVSVSDTPIRKIAYRCNSWPLSGFCGQFAPNVHGGDQGWTLAGSCDGSIGPTSSPSFDALTVVGDGCPQEWSATTTDYEAGDLVALEVSESPIRSIVYQCREWPNSGYCGQGSGFKPATQYGELAWTLKGSCTGTIAPTASPVEYAGVCTFQQCVMVDSPESCTAGSAGCSCSSGQTQTASCVRTIQVRDCDPQPVDTWSNSVSYATDDVVRRGTRRFKCREWPNFLWCSMAAYQPELVDGIWTNAWREDGECLP